MKVYRDGDGDAADDLRHRPRGLRRQRVGPGRATRAYAGAPLDVRAPRTRRLDANPDFVGLLPLAPARPDHVRARSPRDDPADRRRGVLRPARRPSSRPYEADQPGGRRRAGCAKPSPALLALGHRRAGRRLLRHRVRRTAPRPSRCPRLDLALATRRHRSQGLRERPSDGAAGARDRRRRVDLKVEPARPLRFRRYPNILGGHGSTTLPERGGTGAIRARRLRRAAGGVLRARARRGAQRRRGGHRAAGRDPQGPPRCRRQLHLRTREQLGGDDQVGRRHRHHPRHRAVRALPPCLPALRRGRALHPPCARHPRRRPGGASSRRNSTTNVPTTAAPSCCTRTTRTGSTRSTTSTGS